MKPTQVGAFALTLATAVAAFSFSELTTSSTSPPARFSSLDETSTDTGMTVDEENRIMGGAEITIKQYPYVAGLRRCDSDEAASCGGTLIHSSRLPTASTPTCTTYIFLLGQNTDQDRGLMRRKILVVERFRHPLFNRTDVLYDVGLLKLETPSIQQPAKLSAPNGSDNEPGTMGAVLGWGSLGNGSFGQTLQAMDIEIVSNAKCDEIYDNGDKLAGVEMCAGTGNGKGSCLGNSGGPLNINDTFVGIVSCGGAPCGAYPGVYTRVSQVLDYINKILSGGSTCDSTGQIDE